MPTIQYQAFFQGEAGTGWVDGGKSVSRSGSGRLLQALQARLVDTFTTFVVTYDVRFADADWQGTVTGDTLRGDTGSPLRFIDGLCVDLVNRPFPFIDTSILYRVKWANDPENWSEYKMDGASIGRRGVGIVGIEIATR